MEEERKKDSFCSIPKNLIKKKKGKNDTNDLPSKRTSDNSSRVTFSALNSMAMFCDFFGSNTLFSCSTGGRTDLLIGSFGTEFVELHPKRVSIMSSFNLQTSKNFSQD